MTLDFGEVSPPPERDAMLAIRERLSELRAGAAWPPGQTPRPEEIFTPLRQKNVLDLSRSIVVGNRGVGKTFWSHALSSVEGREVFARTYRLPHLENIEAVFGFRGSFADDIAPSAQVFGNALAGGADALVVWQSILLRAHGADSVADLPKDLVDLTAWTRTHQEEADLRLRKADEARRTAGRPLLVLFDALDTLASDWGEIRRRTEGLLRLALLVKGLQATHVKIFMRPDQFADTQLFRFPDASKLRAEKVELQWGALDLYALVLFELWRHPRGRVALQRLGAGDLFEESDGLLAPLSARLDFIQRSLFSQFAGLWMGSSKKRGATYSWLVQHLADARGETTPRGFLTALREAASYNPAPVDLAIDYRGIQHGVTEASENRVDDLKQDYWWIDYIKDPLVGLETPLERATLLDAWRSAGSVAQIVRAGKQKGLLPVYLALRPQIDSLPRELALRLDSDEAAILESLRLIGVAELRPNGKVNLPDIFRVAFKMKRRGGVPPKKAHTD